jgi:hypothetical protein
VNVGDGCASALHLIFIYNQPTDRSTDRPTNQTKPNQTTPHQTKPNQTTPNQTTTHIHKNCHLSSANSQLTKKFSAFYETRRFITVFTEACKLPIS